MRDELIGEYATASTLPPWVNEVCSCAKIVSGKVMRNVIVRNRYLLCCMRCVYSIQNAYIFSLECCVCSRAMHCQINAKYAFGIWCLGHFQIADSHINNVSYLLPQLSLHRLKHPIFLHIPEVDRLSHLVFQRRS